MIPIRDKLLDAAGSVHASVIDGAMNNAALLAASSIVPKELMRNAGFNVLFTGTITAGEPIARGRVSVSPKTSI